ncbi:hypothetical protein DFJ77DRAFT_457758 [Powellomyces hirtus]|nr:hypothetical protein DFJ77DRAFT_457758 [Powellomyces hirtus]
MLAMWIPGSDDEDIWSADFCTSDPPAAGVFVAGGFGLCLVHHEFSAPFGIAAEYAHPIETVVLGQGFFLGPVMLLMMGVDVHVVTMAIWLAVRLIETVDVHAGYDFPWALHHWVPFLGGPAFHDHHHETFKGNYSSSFVIWDWLFGMDASYNAQRAKRNQRKPLASGVEARQKVQ